MQNTPTFSVHAVLPVNQGGIELMYMYKSDEVLYRFNFGEVNPTDKPTCAPIETFEGEYGFFLGAEFYPFFDFMAA